jgi:dipeptidyl aminopeptidase/acylaminoacyl peptidase
MSVTDDLDRRIAEALASLDTFTVQRQAAARPAPRRRRPQRSLVLAFVGAVALGLAVAVVAGRRATTPADRSTTTPVAPPRGLLRHGDEVAVPEAGRILGTNSHTGVTRTLVRCTPPCLAVDYPLWSPDGRWLAFRMFRRDHLVNGSAPGRLALLGADGQIRSVQIDAMESWAWAPDSSAIVADAWPDTSGTTSDRSIVLIDPATGGFRMLAPLDHVGSADIIPAWMPDSRQVAYLTADGHGQSEVVVQPIDGAPRVLFRWQFNKGAAFTSAPLRYGTPVWSPDGSVVVTGRGTLLYVAGADGADVATLRLGQPVAAPIPFWTPDGSALVIRTRVGWETVTVPGDARRRISTFDAYRLFQADPASRVTLFSATASYSGPGGLP